MTIQRLLLTATIAYTDIRPFSSPNHLRQLTVASSLQQNKFMAEQVTN